MKICVGTAQLDMKYGFKNQLSKMRIEDFRQILRQSIKKKINFIDTAENYGSGEKIIGNEICKKEYKGKINIVTKINNLRFIENNKMHYEIDKKVKKSLKNLGIKKLYAVLIHDVKDLKSKKINKIFETLNKIKKMGLIKKIGFSAYEIKDLKKYINQFSFDIIQFPFNVFDQRILEKDIQLMLRQKKVEVHLRSIFLQGLLLLPINQIPKKLFKYKKYIKKWQVNCEKKKINKIDGCLNFVLKHKFYSKMVIGFDNYQQFKDVYKRYIILKNKKKNLVNYKKFIVKNNLINPSKW